MGFLVCNIIEKVFLLVMCIFINLNLLVCGRTSSILNPFKLRISKDNLIFNKYLLTVGI